MWINLNSLRRLLNLKIWTYLNYTPMIYKNISIFFLEPETRRLQRRAKFQNSSGEKMFEKFCQLRRVSWFHKECTKLAWERTHKQTNCRCKASRSCNAQVLTQRFAVSRNNETQIGHNHNLNLIKLDLIKNCGKFSWTSQIAWNVASSLILWAQEWDWRLEDDMFWFPKRQS